MSKKYVYILVEVARRELDSRLVIGIELAKRGMEVIVGEKNEMLWNMLVGKYPPGVILDKCAQFATNRNFGKLLNKGFIYTVLDEEGLLTSKEYFNNNRFSKIAEKYVAANFVTGNFLNRVLLDDYPKACNILSGNPRYSMLHSEWDYWFEEEYRLIKNTYGKFALLVSSFNPYPEVYKYAFPGMQEIDNIYKQKMSDFLSENKNSELSFILRPHPSDQPYRYDNIVADDRFNIIPWIKAAEYIVNAKCTTSLECFIGKKKAYTWKRVATEKVYKLPDLFADELSDLSKPSNGFVELRRKRIMDNMLAFYDDAFTSLEIIADKIEELSFTTSATIKRINIHEIIHFKNKIRAKLNGDNYSRILQKFTDDHIAYAIHKIKKVDIDHEVHNKAIIIRK